MTVPTFQKGSFLVSLGIIVISIVASTSVGIITETWRGYLPNNTCLLYGSVSDTYSSEQYYGLHGSNVSNCDYVAFVPVLFIFVCLPLAIYYFIQAKGGKTDDGMVLLGIFCVCLVMSMLSIVQACMMSVGYATTCAAIRYILIKNNMINIAGRPNETAIAFINSMDCKFHYDALDYFFNEEQSGVYTDTGLRIGSGSSWLIFILWFSLTGLTVGLIRQNRQG
ncbi:hypothetical protein QYM36_013389 [Artemia franciscana]|uniref:Uncharacterized protein n=1 Tax=Artemia franciscana TaxID=6661 RepID=A0AA88HG64_ARTSF|nr:hypothetical protein QYM36_013389 [Artemia franciscana]